MRSDQLHSSTFRVNIEPDQVGGERQGRQTVEDSQSIPIAMLRYVALWRLF